MKKIRTFLRGVMKEMQRVKWPDRKHMFKYSLSTLAFIVFFGLFFYGITKLLAYIWTLIG